MIALITNDLSDKICKFDSLASYWGYEKQIFHLIPFTVTLKKYDFLEKWYRPHLIHILKYANKILLHLQPSKKDLKDPYYEYIPLIYSFLHYHPCIKAKTFIIQPFYNQNSVELKQIYNDKIRLGDFKEFSTESLCSFPVTMEKIAKLHQAIIDLVIEDDSASMH